MLTKAKEELQSASIQVGLNGLNALGHARQCAVERGGRLQAERMQAITLLKEAEKQATYHPTVHDACLLDPSVGYAERPGQPLFGFYLALHWLNCSTPRCRRR